MAEFKVETFIAPEDVRRLALWTLTRLRERTRKGEGPRGPLRPYSTRPFARPLKGITLVTRKNLGDNLKVFTTKSGSLWALIEGGYKAFKEAAYPGEATVNLTATGKMLGALTVISTDGKGFRIGFTRDEEAEKAGYIEDAGREFMDLSASDEAELKALAAQYIQFK